MSIEYANKRKLVPLLLTIFFAAVITATLTLSRVSAAGDASFSLSPNSGTVSMNATIVVTVSVTSSEEINAAQADIAYDAAKFDYVGHSFSGSAFDFALGSPVDNGSVVSVARGKNGVLTGTNELVKLSFKALVDNGSTSLTFAPSSGISASGGSDVWNGAATGGTYAFKAADPANPPPVSESNNTTAIAPASQSGAPTENEIKANSEIDDDQPVSVASVEDKTEYLVAIQVLDKNGNFVADTEVKLGDNSTNTGADGIANFTGVIAGNYTVKALGTEKVIEVVTGDPAAVQSFIFNEQARKYNLILYLAVGAFTAVMLVVIYLIIKKIRSGGAPEAGSAPDTYHPPVNNEPLAPKADLTQNESPETIVIKPTTNDAP